jgi:tetratricopeptide (TPR) repeat protein
MLLIVAPSVSQDGVTVYGTDSDSANCPVMLSVYREFYRLKLYNDAVVPWREVFRDCPASSEKMYVDGVNMYRQFIEEAPDGPVKEGLIDTLMLIYDRRIENFGGEGNVLGRKGRDLLNYRRSNIDQVEAAYGMLRTSVELEEEKTQEAVMVLFISSGATLKKEGKLDNLQVLEDYFMVSGILERLEKRSSRWTRTREAIDGIIMNEDLLSCESLNDYFEPQFEQNQNDPAFLEKMIHYYSVSGCDRSDLFIAASENLYSIQPGPQQAHNLAVVFIARSEFEKAAGYLKEAVVGVDIDTDTRSEWFYELAIVSSANNDYCDAIAYAREAIALRDNFGDAYIALGDAIIASRSSLGDDFQQRAAFWAAADQYAKAASVDPSVEPEASQKLSDYTGLAPGKEEVFFRDLNEGDPYHVEGCINVHTTVKIDE